MLLFSAATSKITNAYFYNITYNCLYDTCISGQNATWHVTLLNAGTQEIEFIRIGLFDSINKSLFAFLDIPFYPNSDKRGNLITVGANKKVLVNITGKLPKASYGNNLLIYYPCFTATITDSYIIAQENKYETTHCYYVNETMLVYECISNDNCRKEEFCNFNSCVKLNCKNCQYIQDHRCRDYECCSSGQCEFNETCLNNTCQNLACNFDEYIYNNSCNALSCAFDEFIFNKTCIKINCDLNEFAFNHTCRELNCSDSEYFANHTCKMMDCKQEEYAKNHACIKLNCLNNESIFNHTCKPLNCSFFQDITNHSCISNKKVIFKLSLEIAAIIMIVLFFVIDFKKFEKKRHDEL